MAIVVAALENLPTNGSISFCHGISRNDAKSMLFFFLFSLSLFTQSLLFCNVKTFQYYKETKGASWIEVELMRRGRKKAKVMEKIEK